MKKFVALLALLAFSASFAINTTVVADKTTKKASRVNVFGNGSVKKEIASATVATVNVTGAGWYQIDGYVSNTATTTVNHFSGGTAGDVIVVSQFNTTRDILINGNTMQLGAAVRTLDDPADKMGLIFDGSTWNELFFTDNN